MNLSMKWLNDYVKLENVTPRQYAADMTMSGSKVEGYEIEGDEISGVVVGRVLSTEKHPDADSLFICQIDVGADNPIQIITGATNVNAGDIVPVALDGSVLPGGKKIKKGKLRGLESNGMLCSLSELGLTEHDFPYAIEDGIFILEEDCQIGQDIREAIGLNDTSVEFEITSNRPDCLSVLGLARETAATYNIPFNKHQPKVKGSEGDISDYLTVEVKNPQLCPRYVARIIKDVKIGPSPRWIRERLRASGVRPINNIVDITNFVMLEYCQPMHAFDHKYVDGGKIIVRNAIEGETITTLDGAERKLSPEMLVIADAKAPSAVAGVMGGEFSCINDDTNTIVFESANFLGSSVRTTAKKLGMRTDSSSRFEKGLDPAGCLEAVNRACELVELLGIGTVVGGIIDIDNSDKTRRRIKLEHAWINSFLGINLTEEEMKNILATLEFEFDGEYVIPPTFRADIEHKADVSEEIARFYGYDKIPVTTLKGLAEGSLTRRQKFDRTINEVLLSLGLYEAVTYSFISPKYYDKINLPADSELRKSVVISNPLGEDTSIMRTTAIPSMLEVLSRNYNNRNPKAFMYEIATEYHTDLPSSYIGNHCAEGVLPAEKPRVVIGFYGDGDYYRLKGIVEVLLERLGITGWDIAADKNNPTFHPGRCAELTLGGVSLGTIGEVHPLVCDNFSIGTRAYIANLDADLMFENAKYETSYKPLPKFPASTRDLAFLCEDSLPVLSLEKAIREAAGKLVEKIELFDVYKGAQIASDKKSVAYAITLRAPDRTLTDNEADNVVAKIIKATEKLGAILRS